ncbi:MAG: winged helix-turn-helix transcriptional regulator [Candidatus Micrarchaeota archaeon]
MIDSLDKIDKRLLYELDWNARQTEAELAKKIGKSRETVRYRIAQLEKKGVITGYATWVDVTKLGYQVYKIYLKIGGNEEERAAFFDALKKETKLFWLGTADGAWDVGLTFFAKSNDDFFHIKNAIFARFNRIILQKFAGVAVGVYAFPKKLFHNDPKPRRQVFGEIEGNGIDAIDKKILSLLFHDSRKKLVALAAEAGVSVDIIRSRMRKMEEKGIIGSYKADIDYQKLGLEFYKAFLYFDSFSKEDEAKLFEIAKQDPNILHIVTLISPWDVELEIMVESYQMFNRIMRRLKADFPNLRNVESATMYGDFVFPAEGTIMKL